MVGESIEAIGSAGELVRVALARGHGVTETVDSAGDGADRSIQVRRFPLEETETVVLPPNGRSDSSP